jgi:endoglucanase
MADKKLLKELSEVDGISGYEQGPARVFKKSLEGYADSFEQDNLGSVVAIKKGTAPLKVMLAAHMDEVGFLVSSIDKDGYIRVFPIGGWWPHVILAQKVTIATRTGKKYIGVFGAMAPHLLTPDVRGRVIDIKKAYIDLGVKSKEEVLALGISPGDSVTPYAEFAEMANPKYLLGKAWDDRIGLYIITEVIRKLKNDKIQHPNTVYGVGTVQEEVGLRGARTAAYKVHPDVAFALDVTLAQDIPDCPPSEIRLGTGAALSFADGSVIAHTGLFDYVRNVAIEKKIPYTIDVLSGGGTDSGEIHKSYDGVVNMTISIPSRHIHSHYSIVHLDDVEAVIAVLVEFIRNFDVKALEKVKSSKY